MVKSIDLKAIEAKVDMLIETETADDLRDWLDKKRNSTYFKTEDVVNSVQSEEQLEVALNYIKCYLKSTNDKAGYSVLIRKYVRKAEELNNDGL